MEFVRNLRNWKKNRVVPTRSDYNGIMAMYAFLGVALAIVTLWWLLTDLSVGISLFSLMAVIILFGCVGALLYIVNMVRKARNKKYP